MHQEENSANLCLLKDFNNYFKLQIILFIADVPTAKILTTHLLDIIFGCTADLKSNIVSCPSPDGVEWQKSNDGKTFDSINIRQQKYYGSSCNSASPSLVIRNVAYEDKSYYRLLVWNKIGEQYSNSVYISVIGSTQFCFILLFIAITSKKQSLTIFFQIVHWIFHINKDISYIDYFYAVDQNTKLIHEK